MSLQKAFLLGMNMLLKISNVTKIREWQIDYLVYMLYGGGIFFQTFF